MKELVTYLARSQAGRPDDVMVTESVTDKGVTVELKVADEDLNHLIGKQGRTIKAMRSLLAAAAVKSGRRFFLRISSLSSGESGDDGAEAVENTAEGEDSADLS